MFEPPPMVTAFEFVVRNWSVDASILVLSARLVFWYAGVFTPLRVTRGPVPWRQELGGEPLLTVKVKLVVFVTPPPMPVIVMVEMPGGVEAAVEIVRVVEQGGEQTVEENDTVAPVGSPETEKDTDCAVLATSVALTVLETEAPGVTDWLPPLVRAKSKEGEADGL